MKITVWIRNAEEGRRTLRTEYKPESKDDPVLQRFCFKLIKAIESGGTAEEQK